MDRDFKGVWIPKEIWLHKELSALDRVLLAEINSLDTENTHCIASNEYFSEFCGVGIATISRSISKLIELGFIEVSNFDGRHRVIKMINQPNQNDKADLSKRLPNNINNNTNTKTISKDISDTDDFLGSLPKDKPIQKERKLSLYDKCVSKIEEYTDNEELRQALLDYLPVRLAMKEKPIYGLNQWVGILKKLDAFNDKEVVAVVRQSIERGWATVFPLNTNTGGFIKKPTPQTFGEDNKVKARHVDTGGSTDEVF